MPSPTALQISSSKSGSTLTPPQKRFNTLIRQIDQARKALAEWHENITAYRQAHVDVLRPLQAELIAGQRQWVVALDALIEKGKWTKSERNTLRDLLCAAAGELLDARGDDAELKALFDKHAEMDFDAEQRERMLAMKSLAEAMTGLDLGDDKGIETEADLFARMRKSLDEQAASEDDDLADAKPTRRRASAAQQRREAEAQQATQSVREIYRKLASALHPDREPDEQQRAEKTALMQRVNQAYSGNDLLALLELQLEIEQIDASHIAGASDQRLKHYNKVLGEQLDELRAEISHLEVDFRLEFGLQLGGGLNPRRLGEVIEQTRRQWRAELAEQQRELRIFSDPAATKRWLKQHRRLRRDAEFDFSPF